MSSDTSTVKEYAKGLDHSCATSSMRKVVSLLAATVVEWPVPISGLGCVLIKTDPDDVRNNLKKNQVALLWDGSGGEEALPPKLVFCFSEEPNDHRELPVPEEAANELSASLREHPRKYLATKRDNFDSALRRGVWVSWLHELTSECLGGALSWDEFVDRARPRAASADK